MNYKEYIEFHDKFTKENDFEFSHGIYIVRDLVRSREVNIKLVNIFIEYCKLTIDIEKALDYILSQNNSSFVTKKAINYILKNLNK